MNGKKKSATVRNIQNCSLCVYCNSSDHKKEKCPLFSKDTAQQVPHSKKNKSKINMLSQSLNTGKDLKFSVRTDTYLHENLIEEENKRDIYLSKNENHSDYLNKSKKCNFCGDDHFESSCLKKIQYLYDLKKEETNKFCSFCGSKNHHETNCSEKTRIEYNINYCTECKYYDHCSCSKNIMLKKSCAGRIESSDKKKTESQNSKTNIVHDESNHSELGCSAGKSYKYIQQCSYCHDYGHIQSACSTYLKSLKKSQNEHNNNYACTQLYDYVISEFENLKIKNTSSKKVDNKCTVQKPTYYDNKAQTRVLNQSKKSSNSELCLYCNEIGHTEKNCFLKIHQNYYSKYCDYCGGNGHLKDSCPLYLEFIEKVQNDKDIINCSSSIENLVDFQDTELCTFCNEKGHSHANCFVKEQNIYYSKYCTYCYADGHTKKECSLLKDPSEKIQKTKNSNDKQKLQTRILQEFCSFCGETDHVEEDCFAKKQCIYDSMHCEDCKVYGHSKNTCTAGFQVVKRKQKHFTI